MMPNSVRAPSEASLAVTSEDSVLFRTAHQRMLTEQRTRADGRGRDRLRLFSPSPVVTLGSGTDSSSLLVPPSELTRRGIDVETVDRGGEATYHGPGQRVGYLTVLLGETERDLHALLRSIEAALIETLDHFGIEGRRVAGHTGVWVDERKIASIGLSVRRWVTGHGFSLCVGGDLEPFELIVPCGIARCPVTSIAAELGEPLLSDEIDRTLAQSFTRRFGGEA
jgi:lipoyl(octanoyl) transferase